jgi:hypothetical protein
VPIRHALAGAGGWVAAALAVLGIVLYASLRVAYEVFYAHLRVEPADVGLDYQRVLSESVGGVLLLAVLVLVGMGGIVIQLRSMTRGPDITRPAWQAAVFVLAIPGVYAVLAVVGALTWSDVAIALFVSVVAIVGVVLYIEASPGAALVYFASCIAVSAVWALAQTAANDAHRVNGGYPTSMRVFGWPLTAWGATVASSTGRPMRPSRQRCAPPAPFTWANRTVST